VVNGTHLFVTAGIGSAEPPVRLWCQPDVLVVDVLPGED
jgi:predicted MPP superfamily phosphohydrolase